ncbi:MAG: DNA polymerase domain-containing protein [Candidatus Bathyarchaeia archaeon]
MQYYLVGTVSILGGFPEAWQTAKTLESYFIEKPVEVKPAPKPLLNRQSLLFSPAAPPTIPPSYLISIGYDGGLKKCFLRLYEPKSHKIYFWFDDSGHKPYCYSKQSINELQKVDAVAKNLGFDHFEEEEKFDALRSQQVRVTKIVAKDPLTIGGKPTGSIRDSITAWEADIKYVENYIYDRGLEPGMMYELKEKRLTPVKYELPEQASKEIEGLFQEESDEYKELAKEWTRLLECPVPQYRRVAVDIEVHQTVESRLPDPELSEQQVICASLVGSDGVSRVLLLRREGVSDGESPLPPAVKLEFYDSEVELLLALFQNFLEYPIVVTFNGDDFDLKYLYHRAQRLGFRNEEIPIELGRDVAFLRYGVHIDLYKFFFNRSIQIYAFGQKYRENTLDAVGEALIGTPKVEIESVSKASYRQLAAYCYRDSEIVLNLTSFNEDLVMKLMTAISRISYMTLDDVSRQGVSGWIRSIMFCHHRKRGYLIPRKDEILEVKGQTTTEAVIKGKKYKGAIVVEPKPGVHFNVAVLDFASLYPSIIKVWNLGYETVRCPHDDCKRNLVPGTPHWVCKKKRGLESLLIGSLRDLRVGRYKVRSKDRTLPRNVQSWYKVVSDALKVELNACFTADTEVLTPTGPRKITDFKVGDLVYTLNEKSGQVEVKPIVECQHYTYDGSLVEVKSRHVDWQVTDNHKLYVGLRSSTNRGDMIRFSKNYALAEAKKQTRRYLYRHAAVASANDGGSFERISLWDYVPTKESLVNIHPNRAWERMFSQTSRFSHYPFVSQLERCKGGRYYKTRKSLVDSVADSPGKFEQTYRCRIRVRNFEGHGSSGPWEFDPLAFYELMGWYVSEGSVQSGSNKRGYKLARIAITQLHKHGRNRTLIARAIKNLGYKPRVGPHGIAFSSRLFAEFFASEIGTHSSKKRLPAFVFAAPLDLRKSLFRSMMLGDGNIKRAYYSTISKRLAADFQHLAFTLGIESTIRPETLGGRRTIYRIKLFGRRHHVLRSQHFRLTPVHKLDVYCVTAQDNHIVYAGRNSKFGWIGQSYGVFGADNFALYCPPVAEATAAIGRHVITQALQKAQELNLEVFYGDTDSIFLQGQDTKALSKLIEWSRDQLRMELEIDKNYRYLALSSRKKNYFGVLPDGSVDIKGLTGKKRHIPEFLHTAFYQMVSTLSEVKSPEDIGIAKTKITEIVKRCLVKLRSKEYTLHELAFSMMMSRTPEHYTKTTPQHVKAARQLQQAGAEMKSGDIVSFVKVRGESGVKPVQLARLDEVDSEKYVEYIRGTFEQVLDALGVEFEDLAGVKKLESFFGG